MESSELRFVAVRPEHAAEVAALFERVDCPCYCQYYGFVGDHREWQNRCSNERPTNRAELLRQLKANELDGYVAFLGEKVVGWARVAAAKQLTKLYQNRLYRGLPCLNDGEREGVHAVACFLVDSDVRRQGVARGLLLELIAGLRRQGARRLEVFPRGAKDVSDEEQFTGPLSLYESLGFRLIHDFGPYPVLSLEMTT